MAIVEYIMGVIIVKMYVVRFTVSLRSLIDSDAPYSGKRHRKFSGVFWIMKLCIIIRAMNIPMDIAPAES